MEYLNKYMNLEPLTFELLNSSIIKEFYKTENIYVTKILLDDSNYSVNYLINDAFNNKTSLSKNLIKQEQLLILLISFFIILFIVYLVYRKKNNG